MCSRNLLRVSLSYGLIDVNLDRAVESSTPWDPFNELKRQGVDGIDILHLMSVEGSTDTSRTPPTTLKTRIVLQVVNLPRTLYCVLLSLGTSVDTPTLFGRANFPPPLDSVLLLQGWEDRGYGTTVRTNPSFVSGGNRSTKEVYYRLEFLKQVGPVHPLHSLIVRTYHGLLFSVTGRSYGRDLIPPVTPGWDLGFRSVF